MNKKVILMLLALVIITGLVLMNWDTLHTEYLLIRKHIPDTPEANEIKLTIERAYDIEAEAAYTFDLSDFSTVFINDPRFPVVSSTLQVVREMTDNLSLETAGYLDYKLAYYTWRANATLHAEEVYKKAKIENRPLTDEEKRSLIDKYGRGAPAHANSPTRNIPIRFIAMEITGDIATVIIDDGPRTVEQTLVLVDKQWYIAGIKGISIHP